MKDTRKWKRSTMLYVETIRWTFFSFNQNVFFCKFLGTQKSLGIGCIIEWVQEWFQSPKKISCHILLQISNLRYVRPKFDIHRYNFWATRVSLIFATFPRSPYSFDPIQSLSCLHRQVKLSLSLTEKVEERHSLSISIQRWPSEFTYTTPEAQK